MSKQSSRGTTWDKTRARILQRDGEICAYCGNAATTVDHVLAKANGGTDDDHNLVAACLTCNGRKSDKIQARVDWYNPHWLDRI